MIFLNPSKPVQYFFPYLIGCVFFIGCGKKDTATGDVAAPDTYAVAPAENAADEITNIEVKTFKIDNGWGYDIYLNDAKYIHQEHIPAVNGLHAFKTESDAQKVADLAVQKIRAHMLPPTISQEELAQMGIVIE